MRYGFISLLLTFLVCRVAIEGAESVRPTLTDGRPAPGKFVWRVAPEFEETGVYHGLYLPTNWRPGQKYPVIVEYASNRYRWPGEGTSGRVEDCRLGYYLTSGRDFLWVVMPYVNTAERRNQDMWWGDEAATIDYCLKNLGRVCDEFGGDRDSIVLIGFSRGAIACGYIGLRHEEIADVWLAFWPHSHIDGGKFTREGGMDRLARTRGRATLVTWGETDDARTESPRGAALLRELGNPVTELEIAGAAHSDKWIEQDGAERQQIRRWLSEVLKQRHGTFSVRGQVIDSAGKGLGGCRVEYGSWHRATTDGDGRFEIRGFTNGTRPLRISHDARSLSPYSADISIQDADLVLKPVTIRTLAR